jgi:hypothetical protein
LENPRDIRKCTTSINYTGGKFATGINDTGGKILPQIPLVLLIPVANNGNNIRLLSS